MLSYTLYRKSFGLSLLYLLFCLFFFVKKDEDFSLIFSREHEKSNISFVHAVTWSHSSYGASSGRGGGRIRRETPSSCSPHLLLTSRSRRQNLVASLSPSCSSSSSSFSSPIDLSISPSNLFLSSLSPVNPSSPLSSSSRGALRTNDLSNRCFSFISPSCSPLTTSLSSCSSARLLPVSSPHALSTSLCSSSGFSPLIERKNDDEFPSCLYSQLPSSSLSSFIQEPDRFFPLKTLGNFFSSPLFLSPYISRLSRRREASCFASLSSPRDHRIQTPSSDFLDLSLVSSPTAFFYYSSSSSFSSPSSSVSPLLLLFQGATRPSPLHSRQLLQATREVQHPTDSLTESKEEREELESAGQIGDDTGGAGEGHFVHAEDMPSHSFPSDSTNSSYTNEAEYYEPSSEGGGEREKSFFSPGEDEEIDNEGEGMAWIDTHHPHDDRERRDSAVELSLEKSGGDRREKATPSPSSYHLNGREEGYRHLSTPGTSRGSTRQRRRYPALSSVSSSSFPNDYGTMPAGEGRDEEEDDRSTSSSSRRVSPVYGDYEGDTPPFSNTRGLRREGERRMRSSPSSFAGVEGGGRTRRSFSSFQGNEEEREREKIRRQEGLIPSGETTGEDKGYSSSTASISGVQTPRRLQGGRRRFNRRGTWEGSFRERRSLTSSSSRFSSISSSQTEHTTSPSPNQEGEGDEEAYRSSSSSTRPISDNETRETDYFYPLDERRDGANEAFPALRSRGDINLQGNWRGGERPYRGRRSFSPTLREDSISSNLPMPRSSSSTSSGKEGTRSEGGIVAYAGEDTNKNLWRDPRIERGEREQDGDLGYERRRPQLEEGLQGRQEEEGQGRRARSISLKRHNFGSPSSLYDGEEHKESRHSSTSFLPRENKTVGEGQKDDERKDASEEGQGERRGSPSSRLSSSFFPSYENDEASSREGGRREFFENRREEYSRRRGTRWLWSRGTRDQQWHEAPSAGADRRREGYRYAEEDLESDRQRDPSKHHVVMPPPEGYPTNQIPRENSLQVEGGEDDRNMLFSQRQRGIRNPLSRRGILYRPPFPRIRGRRPLFPYSRRRFSRGIRGRDAYYLSHPPRPYMTHFYRGDRRAYRNPFFSPSSLGQRRETAPDALGREGRGGDELDEFGDTVDGETRRESGRDRGIEMIRRRGLWRRREEDTEEIPSMPSLPVLLRSLDVGLLLCGGRGRRSSCHSSPDRKENVTDLATDISTLPPPPSPDGTESLTIATSDGDLHGRREENEHERREEEKRNEGNHEKPLSQISSLLDQSSHIHLVGQEEQEDKPSMTGRRRGEEEVAQHTTSLLERAMEEELPLSLEDESIGDLIDDRMRRKLLLLPPIDPHSTVDTPDVQAMRDFTSSLLHVPSPDKKDQAGQDREEEEEKGQATREEEQEAHRHHRTSSGLSENARTLGAPHPGEEQRSSKWYSFKKVYQEALEKFTGHGGDTEQREGVEMNEKIEQVYAYAAFIRRALASRQRRKVTLDAALQRHQIPFNRASWMVRAFVYFNRFQMKSVLFSLWKDYLLHYSYQIHRSYAGDARPPPDAYRSFFPSSSSPASSSSLTPLSEGVGPSIAQGMHDSLEEQKRPKTKEESHNVEKRHRESEGGGGLKVKKEEEGEEERDRIEKHPVGLTTIKEGKDQEREKEEEMKEVPAEGEKDYNEKKTKKEVGEEKALAEREDKEREDSMTGEGLVFTEKDEERKMEDKDEETIEREEQEEGEGEEEKRQTNEEEEERSHEGTREESEEKQMNDYVGIEEDWRAYVQRVYGINLRQNPTLELPLLLAKHIFLTQRYMTFTRIFSDLRFRFISQRRWEQEEIARELASHDETDEEEEEDLHGDLKTPAEETRKREGRRGKDEDEGLANVQEAEEQDREEELVDTIRRSTVSRESLQEEKGEDEEEYRFELDGREFPSASPSEREILTGERQEERAGGEEEKQSERDGKKEERKENEEREVEELVRLNERNEEEDALDRQEDEREEESSLSSSSSSQDTASLQASANGEHQGRKREEDEEREKEKEEEEKMHSKPRKRRGGSGAGKKKSSSSPLDDEPSLESSGVYTPSSPEVEEEEKETLLSSQSLHESKEEQTAAEAKEGGEETLKVGEKEEEGKEKEVNAISHGGSTDYRNTSMLLHSTSVKDLESLKGFDVLPQESHV